MVHLFHHGSPADRIANASPSASLVPRHSPSPWRWTALTLALLLTSLHCYAHETDNFHLPLDRGMADLGDYIEAVHTLALERAVAALNARIETALRTRNSAARIRQLERCHDPEALARAFSDQFSHPMVEDSRFENALSGQWAQLAYEGFLPAHRDISMHLKGYAPLDPRRWTAFTQSHTVKAFGVHFGTDKLVHFHRLGASYYHMFCSLTRESLAPEEAYRRVLKYYTEEGILSEKAVFGTFSTGIYSNADLAVNHIGFKFFQNLTGIVTLRGVECQPLVIRRGVFWCLNTHVRPRSGWFKPYLSDHWNEALNPSHYQPSMRPYIRHALQDRAANIIRFYTQKDGRPNSPEYFDSLARELSTYHGEPYGHLGPMDELMTLGNTCYPALRSQEPLAPRSNPQP